MGAVENIITDNLPIWSSAIQSKSSAGRGTSSKRNLYGVKKLRELILDLAVRGLLVPQDPSDEPASVLLEKIAAEKEQLVKEGKIKKKKSSPDIDENKKNFKAPSNWRWVRLDSISEFINGYAFKSSDFSDNGIGVVKIGDIQNGIISAKNMSRVSSKVVEPLNENLKISKHDMVIAMSGATTGKLGFSLSEETYYLNQRVGKIVTHICDPKYIYFPLTTKILENLAQSRGMAIPNLSTAQINEIVLALPPLAEQHRIVAKVDELMGLCDTLEQQQEDSIQAHETLVEVLLEALSNAVDADAFQAAWGRISEYFDVLFTTDHSINKLKETILQLAVMGKLVPQDPSDEPASVLLENIAAERERLVKEGKIKKHKVTPIHESEHPFILPPGWKWQRLISLTKLITKGSSPKWQGVSYSENTDDVLFVTSENVDSFKLKFIKKKYVEIKFNEIEPRSVLKRNDILMNIVGASIGRTAVFDIDNLANINQAVCLIRTLGNFLSGNFLLIFFNSEVCKNYMFDKQVDNARANLSMGNISNFVLPIPPLAEQHRIVAKVDELMALCDQLKSSLQQAQETQIQLTDAVVENALITQESPE